MPLVCCVLETTILEEINEYVLKFKSRFLQLSQNKFYIIFYFWLNSLSFIHPPQRRHCQNSLPEKLDLFSVLIPAFCRG